MGKEEEANTWKADANISLGNMEAGNIIRVDCGEACWKRTSADAILVVMTIGVYKCYVYE